MIAQLLNVLRKLGFDGPFAGGKHEYMKRGNFRLTIPNPLGKQIDSVLIRDVLKQAGVPTEEWRNAKNCKLETSHRKISRRIQTQSRNA